MRFEMTKGEPYFTKCTASGCETTSIVARDGRWVLPFQGSFEALGKCGSDWIGKKLVCESEAGTEGGQALVWINRWRPKNGLLEESMGVVGLFTGETL